MDGDQGRHGLRGRPASSSMRASNPLGFQAFIPRLGFRFLYATLRTYEQSCMMTIMYGLSTNSQLWQNSTNSAENLEVSKFSLPTRFISHLGPSA